MLSISKPCDEYFTDIPHGAPDSPEKGQTTHFTRFPHSAADSDDEADDKEKVTVINGQFAATPNERLYH